MAEIFGVAAGALGLLGVIDASMSIGGTILDYAKNFREANNEQGRLVGDLTVLQAILPAVKERLETAKASDNPAYVAAAEALEVKDGPLYEYGLALDRIKKELEKVRPGSTAPVQQGHTLALSPGESLATASKPPWLKEKFTGVKARFRKASPRPSPSVVPSTSHASLLQRLSWPSTLTDIKEDLERIQRFHSTVNVILTAGSPDEFARKLNPQFERIRQDIDRLGTQVEGVGNEVNALKLDKDDQQRNRIANWLSDAESTTPRFNATPGTGEWLIRAERFIRWKRGDFRVLYCPGDPGTGKTTLMTITLTHLDNGCRGDPQRMTIRYHFNYQASAGMTMPKLVAHILKKLILHRALSTTTAALHPVMTKPDARPSDDEILSLTCNEIRSYDRVYLVLDALDESPGNMSTAIRSFVVNSLPENVSLLCTSRRIEKIMKAAGASEEVLDLTSHEEDMRKYIDTFFSDTDDSSGEFREVVSLTKDVDQDILRSKVLERAQGMFLLVRLMMVRLQAQGTPRELKEALETLPSGLYEMYEQTIKRSRYPERTLRLLLWVYFAKRGLSPLELAHAVAWNLSAIAPLTREDLESEGRLLSSCGGMVEVRKRKRQSWEGWRPDPVSEVLFTHYTTQEYITHLLEPKPEYFNDHPDFVRHLLTHADITHLCLHYIHYHLTLTALTPELSLLRYCVTYWPKHAAHAVDDEKLTEAALNLLADGETLKLLNEVDGHTKRTCLHLAAQSGLHLLVAELCRRAPEALCARWNGKTPLHIASYHGHDKVVAALLGQDKLDVELASTISRVGLHAMKYDGWSPIHLAGFNGHIETVKLLIAVKDIDVNARTNGGETPLHLAAEIGELEVVKLLSAADMVELNAKKASGQTALHLAAELGQSKVVEFLSTLAGVDLNARDDDGRTPLHLANTKYYGNLKTFESLAKIPGVDLHAKDKKGMTPLELAAERGWEVDPEILSRARKEHVSASSDAL